MNAWERALQLLPQRYLDEGHRRLMLGAEELRLRLGQPLMMSQNGRELPIGGEPIREDELHRLLEKATGASLHTAAPSLARGFLSYHGLRIGVCGTVAEHEGELRGFRSVSSAAVRIPQECRGVCDEFYPLLSSAAYGNILIISPPGGGKTTALRELVRLFSSHGFRVGVADERWEIAAMESGVPQYDLGAHCDVISGLNKSRAAMMLLRGMNPQLIAFDEITQPEDAACIGEIIGCGVRVMATAHAADYEDLIRRPLYRRMMDDGVFGAVIRISRTEDGRKYQLRRTER